MNKELNFDYTKGLVHQIYTADWTLDKYKQYISEAKIFINPQRDLIMFDNFFLELITLSPWWFLPPGWIPTISYLLYQNWAPPLESLFFFLLGGFYWTFFEYISHRWFFHGEDQWMHWLSKNLESSGCRLLYMLHFMSHGVHHAFPQDRYRLVMPPIPGQLILFWPVIYPHILLFGLPM